MGFWGFFHFNFFYFSNTKKNPNKKCNFLFENLIFDIPKFCKTLFWHNVTLLVFSKITKRHYKMGKNNGKQFGPMQFLTLKTPNLGPIFNLKTLQLGTQNSKDACHMKCAHTYCNCDGKRKSSQEHIWKKCDHTRKMSREWPGTVINPGARRNEKNKTP